jgi:hypothetical protein
LLYLRNIILYFGRIFFIFTINTLTKGNRNGGGKQKEEREKGGQEEVIESYKERF